MGVLLAVTVCVSVVGCDSDGDTNDSGNAAAQSQFSVSAALPSAETSAEQSAIESPSAPAGTTAGISFNLTGTWSGQYNGPYQGTFMLTWQQSATGTLTGTIKLTSPAVTLPVEGAEVNGEIKFGTVGATALTYDGSALNASAMSGSYQPPNGASGTWSASRAN